MRSVAGEHHYAGPRLMAKLDLETAILVSDLLSGDGPYPIPPWFAPAPRGQVAERRATETPAEIGARITGEALRSRQGREG